MLPRLPRNGLLPPLPHMQAIQAAAQAATQAAAQVAQANQAAIAAVAAQAAAQQAVINAAAIQVAAQAAQVAQAAATHANQVAHALANPPLHVPFPVVPAFVAVSPGFRGVVATVTAKIEEIHGLWIARNAAEVDVQIATPAAQGIKYSELWRAQGDLGAQEILANLLILELQEAMNGDAAQFRPYYTALSNTLYRACAATHEQPQPL